jgi:hypothetical protein
MSIGQSHAGTAGGEKFGAESVLFNLPSGENLEMPCMGKLKPKTAYTVTVSNDGGNSDALGHVLDY